MSTIKQLIVKVRIRLKDPNCASFSDYELLDYMNDALDFLSLELISQRDNCMLKEATLTVGSALPSDFVEFVGQYPVYLRDGLVQATDGVTTSIPVRYWAKYGAVTMASTTPSMPMYDLNLVQLTCVYALLRDTGGMPADEQVLERIRQNINMIRQKLQAATTLTSTKPTDVE